MAQATSSLGTGGLKRIRRWYNQYLSTHGSPPPEHMMRTYMQSEIEAQIASADKSRALGLEESRITQSGEQFTQSLAQNASQFERQQKMNEQKMADDAEAARMSGYTNMALVGVLGKDVIKSGYNKLFPGKTAPTTEAVPTSTTAPQALPTTETGQSASGTAGAVTGAATGLGAAKLSTAGTGTFEGAGLGGTSTGFGTAGATTEGGTTASFALPEFAAGGEGAATGAVATESASLGATAAPTTMGTVASGASTAIGYAAPWFAGATLTKGIAKSSVPKDQESFARGPENIGVNFSQHPIAHGVSHITRLADMGIIPKSWDVVGNLEEKGMEAIGSVVCTELHRQKLMSDEIYEADERFGRKQDLEVMVGYHSWGIPLAGWMRKSKLLTWIIKPIALAWAENMAYMEGVTKKRNLLGAVIHSIGMPVCRAIGRIKMGGRVWAL